MPSRDDNAVRTARFTTVVIYLVLLAGQFSLNRLGSSIDLPIPLNGLLTILAIALCGYPVIAEIGRVSRPGRKLTGFRYVVAFMVSLGLSGLWASEHSGQSTEYWNIVCLGVLLVLLRGCLTLSPRTTTDTLMVMSAVAGTIYAVAGLAAVGGSARIAAFGGGPNVFARVTGLGIVGVIYLVTMRKKSWWIGIALLPLASATVLSGSRGAMLGALVAVFVMGVALDGVAWRRLLRTLLLASPALLVSYYLWGSLVLKTITERVFLLTVNEHYTSGRDDLWSQASQMFKDRPLIGWGLESFSNRYQTYPHNLFLQTAAEAGLIGLIPLVLAFVAWIVHILKVRARTPLVVGPLAGAALVFVASMFSGGYFDSRFMWVFALLAMANQRELRPGVQDKSDSVPPHRSVDSNAPLRVLEVNSQQSLKVGLRAR